MTRLIRLANILAATLALLLPAVLAVAAPETDGPTAATSFGERALETVRVLSEDIGIRPAGTDADTRAAEYLADQFSAMGYDVTFDPFSFRTARGAGTTQNVIARYPEEDPSAPLVIVGGHYDSVPAGPGGNDNGSGTATVIELARQLAADPVPRVAVRYVTFGAEELGLLGSEHFVRELTSPDRARFQLMISLDMLSVGEQPAFQGSEPWVSHAVARAWSQGWDPVRLPPRFGRLSDHGPFLEAGLPGIFFYWTDDPCWHLACDVATRVQPGPMELMGAIALELIRIAAGR
ncbi:MAG: Zn-dependent exopeptidase M28 [Chloroflexi bacterium]|nr:Zn-dependent exopeptidase M28 [Chloroflexota bacterium]